MSNINNADNTVLKYLASASAGAGSSGSTSRPSASGGAATSWFEAMSRAWGDRLDAQASKIIDLSNQVGSGTDNPSAIAMLTAESLRLQFISQSAATSQNSTADALKSISSRN